MDIDNHGLYCAGIDGQFLLQNISSDGQTVAQQDLICRAADAGEINSGCAVGLRQIDQVLILGRYDQHLRKYRLVPMKNNVDIRFGKDSKVYLPANRRRIAEKYVLQLGGDHGPAPAIGQCGPGAVNEDISIVLIHAHCRSVHHLDNLPIDAARHDIQLPPYGLSRFGRKFDKGDFTFLLAEFFQGFLGYLKGNFFF